MKKIFVLLLADLLVCGMLPFAAAEETQAAQGLSAEAAARIRRAEYVSWAGGSFILADDELIRAEDDSIVLSGVSGIWPWGDSILAEVTNEGIYVFAPDSRTEIMLICAGTDISSSRFEVSDGIAVLRDQEGHLSVQSQKYGIVFQPEAGEKTVSELYRNPDNGDAYILFYDDLKCRTAVYRENGDLVWEGPYRLVENVYLQYVTNGHLTGYDNEKAIVIDFFTGEVTASFSPKWDWTMYMSEYAIYEDNTAVMTDYENNGDDFYIKQMAVVSLDGEMLIVGGWIEERSDPTPGYNLYVGADDEYFWSGVTFQFSRVIRNSDHEIIREEPVQPEELPDSICVNPVLLDPETKDRFPFREAKDEETRWKWEHEVLWPCSIPFGYGHSTYELASRQGWAVIMENDKYRVIDMNFEPVLSEDYDDFYPTGNGYIGRNGGETDFFDADLNLVMSTRNDIQ